MQLPPGYIERHSEGRTCIVREDVLDAVDALGFVTGSPTVEAVAHFAGRVEHPVFALPGTEIRVLWKRCRRGGLVEPILGDRHLGVGRFLRDLELSAEARRVGVPVAELYAVSMERTAGAWKRVEILSRVVEEARDLEQALLDELPPALLRRLIHQTAHELRKFHGHGFVHGDLNLKNLLWTREAPGGDDDGDISLTFIDLDPGGATRRTDALANLLRLYRSYLKGESRRRWQLRSTDLYRFVHDYFRGDRAALLAFLRQARRLRTRERLRPRGWRRRPSRVEAPA